jgi:hypothetical protein
MSPDPYTCKCGRWKTAIELLCPQCYKLRLTFLQGNPAYRKYIVKHKQLLSSLLSVARTYM